MRYLPVIAAAAALAAVFLTVRFFRDRNARRGEIRKNFGKTPGRKNAEYAKSYWETWREMRGAGEDVDRLTWNNLDLDEMYQRINACRCAVGDALLYRRMRRYPDREELERQEKLIGDFAGDRETMYRLMDCLDRIGRDGRDSMRMLTLTPEDFISRGRKPLTALALFPWVSLLLYPLIGSLCAVFVLGGLIVNFAATYVVKTKIYSYRAAYPLSAAVHWSGRIASLIQAAEPRLAGEIEDCRRRCKKISVPFSVMRCSDLLERIGVPDPLAFFQLPALSYFYIAKFVRNETETIARLHERIGEIDAAISIYSFRESLPYWVKPEYTEDRRFFADAVYHPLLNEAVPNDIRVSGGALITGSNASGKSTFLKTVALNLILARAVGCCCAKTMRMKRGNAVTAMAVADSVIEGESYFMAEIKAMKRLVEAAEGGGFGYFFIDEILRGTNTAERIAAAYAFLMYFQRENVLCFAASHDMELTAMTAGGYAQFHFSETVQEGEISFDYLLRDGPSKTRNALKLLEIQKFPPSILSAANDVINRGVR